MTLETQYGTFAYVVEKTEIVDPGPGGVVKNVGYERLVLSACPFARPRPRPLHRLRPPRGYRDQRVSALTGRAMGLGPGTEDRVEHRIGVGDAELMLEAVGDLSAAAARDGHLGRE